MVPKRPLPRPPNSMGRLQRWAGQLMFLPRVCLWPPLGQPPPTPSLLFRKQGHPTGHTLVCRPRLTHPVRQARGGGGHSPLPEQTAELPMRLSPGTQDTAASPALCVGSWQVGPGSQPEDVQTGPGHPLQSTRTAQPLGDSVSLPGGQSASPLTGFKLFP